MSQCLFDSPTTIRVLLWVRRLKRANQAWLTKIQEVYTTPLGTRGFLVIASIQYREGHLWSHSSGRVLTEPSQERFLWVKWVWIKVWSLEVILKERSFWIFLSCHSNSLEPLITYDRWENRMEKMFWGLDWGVFQINYRPLPLPICSDTWKTCNDILDFYFLLI